MSKYLVILITLAVAIFFLSCAQEETKEEETEGSIEGTVTLENATDYSGVRIYLAGTEFTSTTQSDGSFHIPNVPTGPYKIVAEKDGYDSAEKEIEVNAGQVITVEIFLKLKTSTLPPLPGL